MLEHLDDPAPFDVDHGFRSRVRVRARALRARRRRVTAVASTALAAVSATTIVAVMPAGTDSAPINVSDSTTPVETTPVDTVTTTAASTTAVNVLIVGLDQTAPNDPGCPDASSCVGGPRTDTMVVARVEPTNQTLTLVPIPVEVADGSGKRQLYSADGVDDPREPVEMIPESGSVMFVSDARIKPMLAHVRGEAPDPTITRKAMDAKLAEADHAQRYRQRQHTIEPVFANIKANLGYRRFTRRALTAVTSQWRLICASHNPLKLWRTSLA